MKKIIRVICIIGMICILLPVACRQYSPEKESASTEYIDENPSFYSSQGHLMAEDKDGYYFLSLGFLHYYDKGSGKVSLLGLGSQNLSEILKDKDYFEDDHFFGFGTSLFVDEKFLWIIEDLSSFNQVALWRVSKDGEKVDKIKEIPGRSHMSCLFNHVFYTGWIEQVRQEGRDETVNQISIQGFDLNKQDRVFQLNIEVDGLERAKGENPSDFNVLKFQVYKDRIYLLGFTAGQQDSMKQYLYIIDLKDSHVIQKTIFDSTSSDQYMCGSFTFLGNDLYLNMSNISDDREADQIKVFKSDLLANTLTEFLTFPKGYQLISNGIELLYLPTEGMIRMTLGENEHSETLKTDSSDENTGLKLGRIHNGDLGDSFSLEFPKTSDVDLVLYSFYGRDGNLFFMNTFGENLYKVEEGKVLPILENQGLNE